MAKALSDPAGVTAGPSKAGVSSLVDVPRALASTGFRQQRMEGLSSCPRTSKPALRKTVAAEERLGEDGPTWSGGRTCLSTPQWPPLQFWWGAHSSLREPLAEWGRGDKTGEWPSHRNQPRLHQEDKESRAWNWGLIQAIFPDRGGMTLYPGPQWATET